MMTKGTFVINRGDIFAKKKKSVSDRNGAKVESGGIVVDDKTIQFPLLDSVGDEDAKSECLCPS